MCFPCSLALNEAAQHQAPAQQAGAARTVYIVTKSKVVPLDYVCEGPNQ